MADTAVHTPPRMQTPTRRVKPAGGAPLGTRKAPPSEKKSTQKKVEPEEPKKQQLTTPEQSTDTSDATKNEKHDDVEVEEQASEQEDEVMQDEEEEEEEDAPFEDFPDAVVEKSGKIVSDGKDIGVLVEGNAEELQSKKVDEDGDVLDDEGNVVGKAVKEVPKEKAEEKKENAKEKKEENDEKMEDVDERKEDVEEKKEDDEVPEQPESTLDFSKLAGCKVNKGGNVVNDKGQVIGRLVEGTKNAKLLVGKKVDKEGKIYGDSGKVIGQAEPIPEDELDESSDSPFQDFPDAKVRKDGKIVYDGKIIGQVSEGDAKKLEGKTVDPDGDILDKNGNVVGKAERWDEPEPEKKINPLAGRKVNKRGEVLDDNGDPMAKLTEGDVSKCAGLAVDDHNDVLDPKGNTIGHVTLLQDIPPEAEPEKKGPLVGRKVNKRGEVLDDNGDAIAKLTEGDVGRCAGATVDEDNDVVDSKGKAIGHVTLLQDIPPEEPKEEPKEEEPTEPEETPEEKTKREQLEQDKKLANQMANCIQQSLDKIKPVLKMIMEHIDKADRTPKEELDEQKLVDTVKPLIEEGGRILQEANGVIRGLDPDGRISANAKHKTAAREASPEEYRLADLLKELTGSVTETIENAKKKIADMPHAKKELNPLWGLLSEPLFQILAAVGLLLSGVLGLVGKLLNGLGLGGLVNNLLGGLGLTKVLDGLGLGSILAPITGAKKK